MLSIDERKRKRERERERRVIHGIEWQPKMEVCESIKESIVPTICVLLFSVHSFVLFSLLLCSHLPFLPSPSDNLFATFSLSPPNPPSLLFRLLYFCNNNNLSSHPFNCITTTTTTVYPLPFPLCLFCLVGSSVHVHGQQSKAKQSKARSKARRNLFHHQTDSPSSSSTCTLT
ncbi:MAG: hypothetical protein J3R72DRAFT_174925 [Linnemannia gamsii]|nr:MAG: hypothetical protein J3R72DRAFT_174925 [Linnemannia gamsii]